MRVLRWGLAVSMAVTVTVLLIEGRWQEAIPLHLCSLSALAAFALGFSYRAWLLDYLWYLGMPGALLALVFPAPAVSRYQAAMNLSYVITHALILAVPLCALAKGRRVRRGRACSMMLVLQGIAVAAFLVNAALDTNFLFLACPPAGTPLETIYALGYGGYWLALEGLAVILLLLTGAAAPLLLPKLFC